MGAERRAPPRDAPARPGAELVMVLEAVARVEQAARAGKAAGRAAEGEMECPRCGGVLRWRSGGARALRVACGTPGCIRLVS